MRSVFLAVLIVFMIGCGSSDIGKKIEIPNGRTGVIIDATYGFRFPVYTVRMDDTGHLERISKNQGVYIYEEKENPSD